jgi:hypothetical protein
MNYELHLSKDNEADVDMKDGPNKTRSQQDISHFESLTFDFYLNN